jgi:16S rRNA (guanine527-N7)-methyltransferase
VGRGVGRGVGVAWTTTVPCIAPWIAQWYGNVPAPGNVIVRLWPRDMMPVSNAPPSAVAVCCVGSLFVQVTDSPADTVTDAGMNRKPSMTTLAGAARAPKDEMNSMAAVHAATATPFAALARDASRLGVRLSAEQVAVCERYAEELIGRNTSVNLTAITDPQAIATKHFLDSFTALAAREWTGRERLVDVGSGAGFPGLALRIALPGLRLTCLESVGKKARFLEDVTALLGLVDVEVKSVRAEALGRERARRGAYDVGTARAVGTLGSCAEYILPMLRIGGDAIVWKGRLEAELPGAERALAALGGAIAQVVSTSELGVADLLPGRHLVVMRKLRDTPDRYPRSATEMRRRPWSPARGSARE